MVAFHSLSQGSGLIMGSRVTDLVLLVDLIPHPEKYCSPWLNSWLGSEK